MKFSSSKVTSKVAAEMVAVQGQFGGVLPGDWALELHWNQIVESEQRDVLAEDLLEAIISCLSIGFVSIFQSDADDNPPITIHCSVLDSHYGLTKSRDYVGGVLRVLEGLPSS